MGTRGPLVRVTSPHPGTLVRVQDDLRLRRDLSARLRQMSFPAYIPLIGAPRTKIYPPEMLKIIDGLSAEGRDLVLRAYEFADSAFKGMKRKSLKPFIVHLVGTALILREVMEIKDPILLAAGLLHDVIEDTPVNYKQLKAEFGREVADMVEAETKLSKEFEKKVRDLESVRKLLREALLDPRVALLKAADNLDNMKNQKVFLREKQIEHAWETLQIYVPLMRRMGVWEMAVRLEELALKIVNPRRFKEVRKIYSAKSQERKEELEHFVIVLKNLLTERGVSFSTVEVRQRTIAEVFRRIRSGKREFARILESNPLFLSFILVEIKGDNSSNCAVVMDLIKAHHAYGFQPLNEEEKDFINHPRPDRYRARQVLLYKKGMKGKLLVTVTTKQLNLRNRLGLAAFGAEKGFEEGWHLQHFPWLGQLVEDSEALTTAREVRGMVEGVVDEIAVYTDKGELKTLKPGSTVLDFAFKVHTDLMFQIEGAIVDGERVNPFHKLRGGERVTVLTAKDISPSVRWLKYLASPSARERLKKWLRERALADIMNDGIDTLDEVCLRYYVRAEDLIQSRLVTEFFRRLEEENGQEGKVKLSITPEKIIADIGRGERSAEDVLNQIYIFYRERLEESKDRREQLEPVFLRIITREGKEAERKLSDALQEQKFEKVVFLKRPLEGGREEIILGVNVFGGSGGGGLVGGIQTLQIRTIARLVGDVRFLNPGQTQKLLKEIEKLKIT